MRPGVCAADSATPLNPFQELGLLVSSAALFFLAFPNPLSSWGFGPLGFVAALPLLVLVNRTGRLRLLAMGPFAGFLIYLSINYWLGSYHPLAVFIVPALTALEYLVLALALRLARHLAPRQGWLVQAALWVGFEWLKTLGFLGYPYGILGYTQYAFLPLAGLSSLTGVWGVSLLVVWPSTCIAWALSDHGWRPARLARALRVPLGLWVVLMAGALAWGQSQQVDYSAAPTRRMLLVQQNVDPWIGGTEAYTRSLDALERQTRAGMAATAGVDLIVWSETSFIPAIEWHERYREDYERYVLVRRLKDFLAAQPVPVVLGNGEAEAWSDGGGQRLRRDYNAVLVYRGREQIGSYRKVHLVPFSESFPYRQQFPWLYKLLEDKGSSFWEAGDEYRVLEAAGLRFGAPICYEDSFGDIGREFFGRGAELLLNLSNDSWSKSVPAAMQHLAMASFRAMENRRTVVRSTNGGMSALIDPNGAILKLNEPFTESWMAVDVPVYTAGTSPYGRWGDWLPPVLLGLAAAGLAAGAGRRLLRGIGSGGGKTD